MSYLARSLSRAAQKYLCNPKRGKDGIVELPDLIWIMGTISCVIFLIPAVITTFSNEPIWVPMIFYAFVLLGVSFIVAYFNCRIFYNEKGFLAQNFFGKKREFTYDQITAIKMRAHETYLYLGKSRVMVDEIAIGGWEFLTFANEQYERLHNGTDIPNL